MIWDRLHKTFNFYQIIDFCLQSVCRLWKTFTKELVYVFYNWQFRNYLQFNFFTFHTSDNVIRDNHDNSLANYFEIAKTLKLIRRKYYWSNQNFIEVSEMRQQIKKHCETCVVCKRSKTSRHKSYDELSSC